MESEKSKNKIPSGNEDFHSSDWFLLGYKSWDTEENLTSRALKNSIKCVYVYVCVYMFVYMCMFTIIYAHLQLCVSGEMEKGREGYGNLKDFIN